MAKKTSTEAARNPFGFPDVVGLRLRLPAELHRLLKETARQNNRSLNTEMIWRLAHSLAVEGHADAPMYAMDIDELQQAALKQLVASMVAKRKGGRK
jgi:hypothetical protein